MSKGECAVYLKRQTIKLKTVKKLSCYKIEKTWSFMSLPFIGQEFSHRSQKFTLFFIFF